MLDDKFAKDLQKAIDQWSKAIDDQQKADQKVTAAKNRLMLVLMSKFASIFGGGKKSKGLGFSSPFPPVM